jgi:hypothetical protein|tara:strand:+ start:81 stop:452 length:372 start_codon:yes stop_codon:yes gene_type:complete
MEFWLSASLFFGGALCYGIIVRAIDFAQNYTLVKETTNQLVMLLLSVSQDVAFIKSIKYETMESMKLPEEQIVLAKKLDEESFNNWRDTSYIKFFHIYPKNYIKILEDYDWSKITKDVDELYK